MIVCREQIKESFTKDEIKYAASIMADAFSTHATMKQIFSNKKSLYYLFLAFLKIINAEGDILVKNIDGSPVGFLTFMEPRNGKDITFIKIVKYASLDTLKFLWVSITDMRKVFKYLTAFSKKEHISGKNIHLMQAAVSPDYKGKKMMTDLFELANNYYKDYDSIVLETSDESNVGLYKHLGYEIIQNVDELYIFRRKMEV